MPLIDQDGFVPPNKLSGIRADEFEHRRFIQIVSGVGSSRGRHRLADPLSGSMLIADNSPKSTSSSPSTQLSNILGKIASPACQCAFSSMYDTIYRINMKRCIHSLRYHWSYRYDTIYLCGKSFYATVSPSNTHSIFEPLLRTREQDDSTRGCSKRGLFVLYSWRLAIA